jgi:predicted dehydrogenase
VLEAGKHVILEKPATSTSAELDSLFKLAKSNGVFLLEAYRHIQEANFKLLKEAISTSLGTPFGASLTYSTYSSRYDAVLAGETPNIFSLAFSGGSLVDIGVYPIAFAVALWGKPESCTYAPYICPTGVDGGGMVTLKYKTFGVQINQSKCFKSSAPTEIYGENGTITINATTDIESIKFWNRKTKETKELAGEKREFNLAEEAEEMARIIGEGDREAAGRLEEISRIVICITEGLRRDNGIVYDVEKK